MAEEYDDVPLEEKLIQDTEASRPKTKEDLAREAEMDARAKNLIFVKPSGKITDEEATIIVTDESHGFCNVIKRYLVDHDQVLFASYKKEFGVDPSMFINTDGTVSAFKALLDASNHLHHDLVELEKLATAAVKKAA